MVVNIDVQGEDGGQGWLYSISYTVSSLFLRLVYVSFIFPLKFAHHLGRFSRVALSSSPTTFDRKECRATILEEPEGAPMPDRTI